MRTIFALTTRLSCVLPAFVAGIFVCCSLAPAAARDIPLLDASPWQVGASDGVKATLSAAENRLDYDIEGAGYACMTHALDFKAPENFEIDVPIKGAGGGNDLQIKFDDASGDNVWWAVEPAFGPGRDWTVLKIRPRHIQFAWGPTADRAFKGGTKLEIVVVKTAKGSARGSLSVGKITWHEEPPPPAVEAPLKSDRAALVDGNPKTVWRATPGEQAIIDLSRVRDFGGVRLDWAGRAPRAYEVAVSTDGHGWFAGKRIADSDGGTDLVALGEIDARYIRIAVSGTAALAEVSLLPLAVGEHANDLLRMAAKLAPKGDYPRAYLGRQSYWTLIGVAGGGSRSSLLSEDGAVELGPEGASLEPFVKMGRKRLSWADVAIEQNLKGGDLPMPGVEWRTKGMSLDVRAFAFGDSSHPFALARYDLRNTGAKRRDFELELAVRPMQVNPPAQFLTRPGGFSPIRHLKLGPDFAEINGRPAFYLWTRPTSRVAGTFQAGAPFAGMTSDEAREADGLAAGAYGFAMTLRPREKRSVVVVYPLSDDRAPPAKMRPDAIEAQVAQRWRETLSGTRLTLPKGAPEIGQNVDLAVAYILMLKDHDLLKPGARSYDRAWIRDGAMIAEALLRTGHFDVAVDFFKAYAPFVFASGKVPCCVDARGADPTPENDSNGEFAWLAGELIRYGWKPDEARPYWPRVRAALAYLDQERQSERTPANQTPETQNLYGLLPPSISHEGYSDKPAFSYWDDLWALKGYRGGAVLARALGDDAEAQRLTQTSEEFAGDLKASILATARKFHEDTISGAADRGDFDPTSTTIGLTTGAHRDDVPPDLARNTFDAYWARLVERQAKPAGYTPYELRSIAAFLRLKQPARARAALGYFLADQAPPAWRQWAEVVAVPRRKETFLGDLPHGWVESDFLRSALDLFAYERPDTRQMVLIEGFDPAWARLGETRLDHLHTPYGELSLRVSQSGGALDLAYDAEAAPPGGFVIDVATLMGKDARVVVDGKAASVPDNGELILHEARADVEISKGAR
ncbi:MAG: discoidin domain-containing protein [Alphaproteobacteria bacterium]|nr:discoidin domain-containing protein [Alphaproteobacteria bacterium]